MPIALQGERLIFHDLSELESIIVKVKTAVKQNPGWRGTQSELNYAIHFLFHLADCCHFRFYTKRFNFCPNNFPYDVYFLCSTLTRIGEQSGVFG